MSVSSVISPGSWRRLGDRWTGGAWKVSHSSNSLRTQFAHVHSCIFQRRDTHANMGTRAHTQSHRVHLALCRPLDSRAQTPFSTLTQQRFVTQRTPALCCFLVTCVRICRVGEWRLLARWRLSRRPLRLGYKDRSLFQIDTATAIRWPLHKESTFG